MLLYAILDTMVSFQNTNPERGRKLAFGDDFECIVIISEHEPRKGTETIGVAIEMLVTAALFQNTNPERGRKH